MPKPDPSPILSFETRQGWEDWLEEHGATAGGAWLKLAKKGTGIPSVSFAEAQEAALCYGWVDSQSASLDDRCWLLKFTHRRPKSKWSQTNRVKAEELIAAGRMRPAGLREVDQAKWDGRWDPDNK